MNLLAHAPALAIAIPLLAAFAMPIASRVCKRLPKALSVAALAFTELLVLSLAAQAFSGKTITYALGAVSPDNVAAAGFPVRIILEIDALSALFAIASATIALLAIIYSIKFVKDGSKFFAAALLMVAGMLGMVFTGDIFSLFVFIELLTISSAALIAFYSGRGQPYEAAFKYLVVSSIAALMILLSAGLFYGQYNLLNLAALAGVLKFTFLDKIALVLLTAALAMKCGAIPLHMWVSDAYGEAPASVSAMLVVASQASLYALFRISFILFGKAPLIETIAWALIVFGVLSMFVGVSMAIMQKDIKRLMAYHAVSQTGYMLLGAGVCLAVINNPAALTAFGIKAIEGSLFHVINHTLYKSLLFLTAGAVIYRLGTRNLNEMGGLAKKMPWTAAFFVIGALAIAGLPPFNGFASKFLLYESVFLFSPILSAIAMLVSIMTLASFVKVFYAVFLGNEVKTNVKEVPLIVLAPMALIAIAIILFGLFPEIVLEAIVKPAAGALLNQTAYTGSVL